MDMLVDEIAMYQQYIVYIEGSHFQVNLALWADEDDSESSIDMWREYSRSDLISALHAEGLSKNEAQKLVAKLQNNSNTKVVSPENEKNSMPLRPAGFQYINGVPWFIRKESSPLKAEKGNPVFVLREICQMFGNEAPLLLGWLKGAYTRQLNYAAEARGEKPLYKKVASQTLAIVGAPGTGKTHVLLNGIMRGLLGDYTVMPAAWLCGNCRFNDWALKSNIWVADDGVALRGIRERKHAATILKQAGYSSKLPIECKNKAVINLDYPCERVFIVNPEEEALRALPAYEENKDKYLFLHNCAPSGLISEIQGDFDRFYAVLQESMPAFAYWLLHEYNLPEWATTNTIRHTVADIGYMSPAVRQALSEQDEAGVLLARLRKCYISPYTKERVRNKYLSQEDLRSIMEGLEGHSDCTSSTKMGKLLTECISRWPHMIEAKIKDGYRLFCLKPHSEWQNPPFIRTEQYAIAQPDPALLEAAGLPPDFNPLNLPDAALPRCA